MDHQQAAQLKAVDKYLLDELTPEVRDKFEEHFFDCRECAADLRATAAFMAAAKNELKRNPVSKTGPVTQGKSLLASFWPAALVWSALAASLLVIVYQNMVVFPRFENQISELQAPQILPSLSLVGGNSRGGRLPAVTVGANQPFLLLVDIPSEDRFSSYTALLFSPSGSLSWKVEVPAQLAKDTVSIRVPSAGKQSGEYTLAVQGNADRAAGVDLAHYRFTLNSHD
jgi:hypothetical protein